MPQMSPLSWLILYIGFSMVFIVMAIMNYYVNFYNQSTSATHFKTSLNSMSWKW
nr:ATP synthase F0 subunit 8 [Renocera pallida]